MTPVSPGAARPTASIGVARVALIGVLGVALVLRLWSVDWQLPWLFHPDEGHYVWKAVDMQRDGNLNPKYFRNPSLYTYLLLVEYQLASPLLGILEHAGELARPPSIYTLIARVTSAAAGVASVGVLYLLGRELFGLWSGLVGALLLAVSLLHTRDSHFATNDVLATLLLLLSMLASARLLRSGSTRHLVLASLLGGMATSAKYNTGLFLVPLLLAGLLCPQGGRSVGQIALRLAAAGGVSLAAFLAGTPFSVLDWPRFAADFDVQRRFAREGWEGQGSDPIWWLYVETMGEGCGWLTLALAVVGLAIAFARWPRASLVAFSFPLVYLAFMLTVRLFFARFATPLAPFACLGAGIAIVVGAQWLVRRRSNRLLVTAAAIVTAVAVWQPLAGSIRHNLLLAQPDSRTLAWAWLEQHVPPGSRIAADEYTVRDRRPRADLPDRQRYDLDLIDPLSRVDLPSLRQRYEYAIVSSFQYQRFPGRYDTYGQLDGQTITKARFSPAVDGGELAFDVEELYSPFHGLERYQRPGPTVKIYELKR